MDFNRTELRTLLLATGLILLGEAARLGLGPGPADLEWREGGSSDTTPGLADTRDRVAAGVEAEERAATPLAPGEMLDPNTASAIDLRRLPGIGPSRAAAIIKEREAAGPFRDLQDLARVPGIGPATLAALEPSLTLRPGSRLRRTPGGGSSPQHDARIDVNRAQIKELEQITGIGPALAARIVEVRRRRGPFRDAEDLLRVPGIGPGILHRIHREVRF